MTAAKPITILLAEDHAIVRQGLSALLNAGGNFKMIGEARTGREAVEMAQSLRPDVILMDIAMPVLNGLEATRQILAANPTAKVIILSAHSDDEFIERTTAIGAVGFLAPGVLPPDWGWRFAFGIGAVLGLAILLLRRWVPESPRWLMLHDRLDEAEAVIGDIEKRVEGHQQLRTRRGAQP